MPTARGVLGAAAAAIAVTASTFVPAAAAPAAAGDYVALGDSYASGQGAGDYGDSGSCARSANSFSQLWADANSPASFQFMSCSGAKTDDVLANQVGALNADTDLVSIAVGGNDAGFVPVMTSCITGGDSGCKSRTDEAIDYARNTLPAKLDAVYGEISGRAPSAKVVVLGYPHIYKIGGSCVIGLSDTSRGYINGAADALDDVIASRAGAAGFTYVDGRQAFADHELCSGSPWLHGPDIDIADSYHPNQDGQSQGYLPAFTAAAG
jgi:lysophospholipase L1-like esterase